jgi:uncharacterized membrane protein YfcA
MEVLIGFLIAFVIAMTGVGAGTITAPLLILMLHVPIAVSVGTALAYSTLVKLIVVPVQIWRRQVDYKVLGSMLLGGLPGVIFGSLIFRRAASQGMQSVLYWALGLMIVISSSVQLYRHFRPDTFSGVRQNRLPWIAALMFHIGAEVGFSSSGAGALGTIALLSLSSLTVSRVVGTDLAFGFCISMVGSGLHMLSGGYDPTLLYRLIIGGILGALVGSSLAPRLPNRYLRLTLAVWLLAIGIQFCYQAARLEEKQPDRSAALQNH